MDALVASIDLQSDYTEVIRMKREKKSGDVIIEVDFRRVGFLAVTVLMCVLVLVSLLLFFRGFLPVRDFEVEGVSAYYDRDQLIAASGIEFGALLYDVDTGKVEKKMLEECVYLESIEINRVFPNKIRFSVVEKTPQWYIEISGDYYVLDADLTVLQESTDEPSLKGRRLTRLELPSVKSAICGELPAFGADELEIKRTCEIINTLREHPLKSRLTYVSIASRFEIYLTVDHTYEAYCGDMSAMDSKMDALAKILTEEFCAKYSGADIDLSSPSTVGVVPKT